MNTRILQIVSLAVLLAAVLPGSAEAKPARQLSAFRVRNFHLDDPFLDGGFFTTNSYQYYRYFSGTYRGLRMYPYRYGHYGYRYGYGYGQSDAYLYGGEPRRVITGYEPAALLPEKVAMLRFNLEYPPQTYLEPVRKVKKPTATRSSDAAWKKKVAADSAALSPVHAYFARGDHARAAAHLRAVIAGGSLQAVMPGNLRSRYADPKRFDSHLAALERRVGRRASDRGAQLLLAYIYLVSDQADDAVRLLERLVRSRPADEEARDLLRIARRSVG